MARRRVPDPVAPVAEDGPPAWLWEFVVADWPARDAADAEVEATAAREYSGGSDLTGRKATEAGILAGREFAREVHASVRWSAARRAWAVDHGMTLREMGALVRELHTEASPYPIRST